MSSFETLVMLPFLYSFQKMRDSKLGKEKRISDKERRDAAKIRMKLVEKG